MRENIRSNVLPKKFLSTYDFTITTGGKNDNKEATNHNIRLVI